MGLNLRLLCSAQLHQPLSTLDFLHCKSVQSFRNKPPKSNFHLLAAEPYFKCSVATQPASGRQSRGMECFVVLQIQLGPCAASGICPTCLVKPLSSHTEISFLLRALTYLSDLATGKLSFAVRTYINGPPLGRGSMAQNMSVQLQRGPPTFLLTSLGKPIICLVYYPSLVLALPERTEAGASLSWTISTLSGSERTLTAAAFLISNHTENTRP